MDNLGKWLGGRLTLRRIHFALSLRVTLAALLRPNFRDLVRVGDGRGPGERAAGEPAS